MVPSSWVCTAIGALVPTPGDSVKEPRVGCFLFSKLSQILQGTALSVQLPGVPDRIGRGDKHQILPFTLFPR